MAFPCFWKKAKRLQKLCSPKGTRCCSAMVGMLHLRPFEPCYHSTPSRGKNLDLRLKPVENKWSRTCAKDQSGKDRMPGEDYEIQEGDCVSSVAFSHGFFWETLWNHGNNFRTQIQAQRPEHSSRGRHITHPGIDSQRRVRRVGKEASLQTQGGDIQIRPSRINGGSAG